MTDLEKTKPEVFIIESLGFDDEKKNRHEGKIISNILHLHGKKCEYYYIRTRAELEKIIDTFYKSNYRYLHLSCHGNPQAMGTTLDTIDFEDLGKILRPCLHERRLFISSCEMVNTHLANTIMPGSDCYSIIGPSKKISFSDATILWASLYHLMFKHDTYTMKREELLKYCTQVTNLFRVPLNYFGRDRNQKNSFGLETIRPRKVAL